MRTLLKIEMNDMTMTNEAIQSGRIHKVFQWLEETLRPEASYFFSDNGVRSAFYIFDLKDSVQIPSITEPLFDALHASVTIVPVMNREELRRGLESWRRNAPEGIDLGLS